MFHRNTEDQNSGSYSTLHFDQEGSLLAAADVKPGGGGNIELIDLQESRVRWSVPLQNLNPTLQMEFTSDHSSLIVSSWNSTYRIDVQTGAVKEIPASSELGSFLVFQLRRSENGEKLFAVGYAVTSKSFALEIRDAVTGEKLRSVQLDPNKGMRSGTIEEKAIASPDGQSIVRINKGLIELWDTTTQQRVFNLSGTDCVFSTDGRSLVVTTSSRNSGSEQIGVGNTATAGAVNGARIVAATNGRVIAEFSFAGDPADEVRLSTDGSRLLSLHGKRPDANRSRSAHARLWDCASGREILDLPINAEFQSPVFWDLHFSPTGDSLTGVVLSRIRGNATGSRSFVFDAKPLSPEADAQLTAENLFRKLEQTTPVPQQIVDVIHDNKICVPLVRQIALELASHVPFDAEKIAGQCMEVLERTDHELVMYERVLSWARALEKSEPGSLRAISLISAAQYRLGQADNALQTLQQADKKFTAGDTSNLKWEHLRRAVEVLCLHHLSKDPMIAHRKAIDLADFVQDAYSTNTTDATISWSSLVSEALTTQGRLFSAQQIRPRYRPALVAAQAAAPRPDNRANNVKFAEPAFRRLDANGDQVISQSEAPSSKEWEQIAGFDRDGIDGLSLSEWTAGQFLLAATAEATRAQAQNNQAAKLMLSKNDQNKDGRVTVDDYPEDARKSFRKLDTDQNDELSLEEYQSRLAEIAFSQALMNTLRLEPRPLQGIQLLTLNAALDDHPGDVYLLNARAWILATCADDSLRNGDQAVRDATQACEADAYTSASMIDTLAAAYAEQGDFEKAVQYAGKACSMIGSEGTQNAAMKERLELYKQKKPYRDASAAAGVSGSEAKVQPQPLIPATHLNTSRRIRGGEPCWTADGQRLIYSLTGFSADGSYLETLDLITGETKILCRGGTRPVCSPVDGTIAFERGAFMSAASVRTASVSTTQIWLVDADGRNERKLSDGHRPHWTLDGNLCYCDQNSRLVCVSHNKPDELLWSRKAPVSERFNLAFSPDGTRVAWSSFGKWNVFSVPDTAELPRPVLTTFDLERSHWSPDGRRIAFSATNDSTPGVWLFDLETQETRLLADIAAIPRWSPDGKTLALGLQSSNEILLLDVSSLKHPGGHE